MVASLNSQSQCHLHVFYHFVVSFVSRNTCLCFIQQWYIELYLSCPTDEVATVKLKNWVGEILDQHKVGVSNCENEKNNEEKKLEVEGSKMEIDKGVKGVNKGNAENPEDQSV